MKQKLLGLLSAAVLLLSLSACGTDGIAVAGSGESTSVVQQPASQPETEEPSEAEITALADRLMQEGQTVFWWYHSDFSEELGIDFEAQPLQADGQEWQKVGRFATMDQLKAATEAVFTPDFCRANFYDKIEKLEQFKEINGVLYHNVNVGGMGWIYSLPKAYIVESADENQIVLSAICDGLDPRSDTGGLTEYTFALTLLRDGDAWKINSYYNFSPDGFGGDLSFRDGTQR